MKIVFIFIIFVSLNLSCFSQTKVPVLKNKDKATIIKSILSKFFQDYPDEIESDEIALSTLNIDASLNPQSYSVKLVLLNPDDIKAKAIRKGFLDYLAFTKFEIKGSKVLVTLESVRLRGDNPDVVPVFGHGFIWEYWKKSGKWKGKHIDSSSFITACCLDTTSN